jgi:predicted RNA-binding protein with PUA-like domain
MNYWLVKSEPAAYAWAQFVKDGGTAWTGGGIFRRGTTCAR